MLWKSNAGYNEDAKKSGTIFELKDNKLGIRIHKYVGCGDELFLSCRCLGINMRDLGTEDFDKAVEVAKGIIYKEVLKLSEEADKFYLGKSENEFTIY